MIDAGGGYSANIDTSVPGLYTTPAGLVGTVAIGQGGTGQTTAAAALAALGGVGPGSHSLKRGTAGGNYVITSTSFVAIDDTNLKVTATVPVGQIALAVLQVNAEQVIGASGALGVAVDGTVAGYTLLSGSISQSQFIGMHAMALLVGDGASHDFSPQGFTTNGSDAFTVLNTAAQNCPLFVVLLLAAL